MLELNSYPSLIMLQLRPAEPLYICLPELTDLLNELSIAGYELLHHTEVRGPIIANFVFTAFMTDMSHTRFPEFGPFSLTGIEPLREITIQGTINTEEPFWEILPSMRSHATQLSSRHGCMPQPPL